MPTEIMVFGWSLLCGVAGGHLAGRSAGARNLRLTGNALAGLVGGALGGQILESSMGVSPIGWGGPNIDAGMLISLGLASASGGAATTVCVTVLRAALSR